jgi:glycogen debranching enzyme GlgX
MGRRPPAGARDAESILYEAHVKGFTAGFPGADAPGTFLALGSDPVLDYLTDLGITAIELLPVHAFLDDRFLVEKGLTNYWGYQTIGFFAPEPRYLHAGQIAEFQYMVARLHAAGIEVILDVVYNHTGEGNETGPTLSFRGLDNLSYYRLAPDMRGYINDTGTGNTVNVDHPMVLRMILDSLRYWVEVMHVDGFRFDLCSTLGRTRGASTGRGVLRRDPAGPGPDQRQAHRRALGYRARRLPAGRVSPAVHGMERQVPRRRAAVLARRRGARAGDGRPSDRLGAAIRPFRPARHRLGQHADGP